MSRRKAGAHTSVDVFAARTAVPSSNGGRKHSWRWSTTSSGTSGPASLQVPFGHYDRTGLEAAWDVAMAELQGGVAGPVPMLFAAPCAPSQPVGTVGPKRHRDARNLDRLCPAASSRRPVELLAEVTVEGLSVRDCGWAPHGRGLGQTVDGP